MGGSLTLRKVHGETTVLVERGSMEAQGYQSANTPPTVGSGLRVRLGSLWIRDGAGHWEALEVSCAVTRCIALCAPYVGFFQRAAPTYDAHFVGWVLPLA